MPRWFALAVLLICGGMARAETWRVVYNEFAPYSETADTGQVVGFAIDMLRSAVSDRDVELEFLRVANPGIAMQMLADGEADLHPHLAPNATRAAVLDFTTAIKSFQVRAYQRRDRPEPADTTNFPGLRIGVSAGSLPDFIASRYRDARVVRLQDNDDLFFALANGGVDIAFYADNAFESIVTEQGVANHYRAVGPVLAMQQIAMGVRRTRPDILQALDGKLRDLVDTPEYWAIHATWFGGERPRWIDVARIWPAAGLAVLLAVLAITLARFFRRRRVAAAPEQPQPADWDALVAQLDRQARAHEAEIEETRQLLQVMSYELRSPLASLSGYTEMLREARREEDAEVRAQMYETAIERIQSNTENLRRMIGGLADPRTFETGPVDYKSVSLAEMAQDIEVALAPDLAKQGCRLGVRAGDEIRGDPDLIRRAVQAMVQIALRRRLRHGPATIEILKVEDPETASICLHDPGDDISSGQSHPGADLNRYAAADGQGDPELALVRRVAHRHGGGVRVTEDAAGGVTFWLTLSREPPASIAKDTFGDAA